MKKKKGMNLDRSGNGKKKLKIRYNGWRWQIVLRPKKLRSFKLVQPLGRNKLLLLGS